MGRMLLVLVENEAHTETVKHVRAGPGLVQIHMGLYMQATSGFF